MAKQVRSGIFFHRSIMRYAEVERSATQARLLRLGSCDFEFDAEAAALGAEGSQKETIREALRDVFSGSTSPSVSVVLGPRLALSFFSPISNNLSDIQRQEQLESEARMLVGDAAVAELAIEPIDTATVDDEVLTWHHVTAVPDAVRASLAEVLSALPHAKADFLTAVDAAVRVDAGSSPGNSGNGASGASVLVGRFPEHTEIAILAAGRRLRDRVSLATAASDVCYFTLSLLEEVGMTPNDVHRVGFYGESVDDADLKVISSVLSAPSQKLDPLQLVANRLETPAGGFDANRYVLCIGAAL